MKNLVLLALCTSTLAFAGDPPKAPAAPAVVAPVPPPSGGGCFELSVDGKTWSKTPELMCIGAGDKNVAITMKTGMPPIPTEVAVFHLDLTNRVRCADCNKDVFSLSNPTNSVFNNLKITFDGKRDLKAGTETGIVSIGKTKLHYRSVK